MTAMYSLLPLAILFGSTLAARAPGEPDTGIDSIRPFSSSFDHIPSGNCRALNIDMTYNERHHIWAPQPFKDNADVDKFLKDTSTADPLAGTKKDVNKYTIAASFCSPKTPSDGKEKTVLLATHDVGVDGCYWAPKQHPENSFAEATLKKGFSFMWYDRAGVGSSSKASGYLVNPDVDMFVLDEIARTLHYNAGVDINTITNFGNTSKVVLVGHGYGSQVVNGIQSKHFYKDNRYVSAVVPVDAVVLTGWAYSDASTAQKEKFGTKDRILSLYHPQIASTVSETEYPKDRYDSAWMATKSDSPVALPSGFADTKAPYTLGQLIGASKWDYHTDQWFKSPVLIATGEKDQVACGETSCEAVMKTGKQDELLSGAGGGAKVETYIQPGAHHWVNYESQASSFFDKVLGWVAKSVGAS